VFAALGGVGTGADPCHLPARWDHLSPGANRWSLHGGKRQSASAPTQAWPPLEPGACMAAALPRLTADQVRTARRLYDQKELTVDQIGDILGVSRTTIYRAWSGRPLRPAPPAAVGRAIRRRSRPRHDRGRVSPVGPADGGPVELVRRHIQQGVPLTGLAHEARSVSGRWNGGTPQSSSVVRPDRSASAAPTAAAVGRRPT